MKEKYATDVLLADVDGKTLLNLIEYSYKGETKISEENADSVLAAADMLRFTPLVQQCTSFYENNLNASNCLGVWALAKMYSVSELIQLGSNFAFDHFGDVVTGDEFKFIEIELLTDLLRSDKVNVASEEEIFNAIVVWMEVDLANRMSHIQDLMQTVRVGHLKNLVCTILYISTSIALIQKKYSYLIFIFTIFSFCSMTYLVGLRRPTTFNYLEMFVSERQRMKLRQDSPQLLGDYLRLADQNGMQLTIALQ